MSVMSMSNCRNIRNVFKEYIRYVESDVMTSELLAGVTDQQQLFVTWWSKEFLVK
jgi:hypothetical protein